MTLHKTVLLTALLLMAGCTPDTPASVSDAWVRLPAPGSSNSAAYMTINNHASTDLVLTEVRSSKFERIEIHRTQMVAGVMQMRMIPELSIPPSGQLELQPGGLHLMLMEPTSPITEGERIPLTLLSNGEPVLELNLTVSRQAP
ncbi:MAG: copper chaperone PCu(A)C [Pseudomonadota bacterium]